MHSPSNVEVEQLTKRRKELLAQKSAIDAELRAIDEKLSRVSPQSNQSKKARFISLFAKLFKGRHDVYAVRWESSADNRGRKRSGYNVSCANKFKQGLCSKTLRKGKTTCAKCGSRKLVPFDEKVIEDHLAGKITAGIYPLLKDDTCHFLAIDLDKEGWQEDVKALSTICKTNNIIPSIERSRSGKGAHVWFFFTEPIKASKARRFGFALLNQAATLRYQIGLHSFDRLFPNQDFLPKGGFGNLIALPMQKLPREQGNSMFVDENFEVIKETTEFLETVQLLTESDVSAFLKSIKQYETENDHAKTATKEQPHQALEARVLLKPKVL